MIKYKIIPTPSYKQELALVYNYIYFKLKNPITAKRLYNNVKSKILSLQYFPERCSRIPIYKNNNVRKILVNDYIIIYQVNTDTRTDFYSTYFP